MRNINKILTFFIKVPIKPVRKLELSNMSIILSLTLNRMLIKQQF